MAKFKFGDQTVEIGVLCLATVRVATSELERIKGNKSVGDIFDAFLKILVSALEDPDDPNDPAKNPWTYRKLSREIKGAEQMNGVLTGVWELLQESGFVKKGEPLPGSEPGSPEPGAEQTPTPLSTGSSSQSLETGSRVEAGAP